MISERRVLSGSSASPDMIRSLTFGERNRVSLDIPPELRHLLGNARFELRIPFGDLRCLLLHLPVLVLNLAVQRFEHPVLFRDELVGLLGPLLGLEQLALGLFLLGDVGHHRDRAAAAARRRRMRYHRPSGVWSSKLLPVGLRRLSTRWATSASTSPSP